MIPLDLSSYPPRKMQETCCITKANIDPKNADKYMLEHACFIYQAYIWKAIFHAWSLAYEQACGSHKARQISQPQFETIICGHHKI